MLSVGIQVRKKTFGGVSVGKISERFRQAAKLSPTPLYKLSIDVGIPPHTIYRMVRGIQSASPDDQRIIALGEKLGVPPEECVEPRTGSPVGRDGR